MWTAGHSCGFFLMMISFISLIIHTVVASSNRMVTWSMCGLARMPFPQPLVPIKMT